MRQITETDRVRIGRLLMDSDLSGAIYDVLLTTFLKKRDHADVQMAAAERIAIDLLNDGWKELEKCRPEGEKLSPPLKQVGL